METVGCPLCGDAPSEPAIEENGFVGNRCDGCGLIYVSPRPAPDEVAAFYVEDRAHVAAEVHLAGADSSSERRRARRTLREIRRHAVSGRLLEVGAGGGVFARTAREAGYEPLAVEVNPVQAAFIRDELGIDCRTSLEEVEAMDGARFDVIYHCDVLSHFSDPVGEFHRLHALLRPGGVMVFETGNGADVDPRHYKLIRTFQYPDHLYFFGERSLDALLRRTSFARIVTRRYSLVPALWVEARLRALAERVRRAGAEVPPERAPSPDAPASAERARRGGVRAAASDGVWTLLQELVYVVGAIAPKRRRPQTQLVVARSS